MKNLKFILSLGITVLFINCSNLKNKDNTKGNEVKPKLYTSIDAASTAAKNDMGSAMDMNVNFGVDKEKLKEAKPGAPVQSNELDMQVLIKGDSASSFAKLSRNEGTSIVPLFNGSEVIAVVGIQKENDQYRVTSLGDLMLSNELNMLYRMSQEMKGTISVYQISNLSATVYEIKGADGSAFYSSYNGHNLKLAMKEAEIIRMLRADAIIFEKKFGEKIRKQKLVK